MDPPGSAKAGFGGQIEARSRYQPPGVHLVSVCSSAGHTEPHLATLALTTAFAPAARRSVSTSPSPSFHIHDTRSFAPRLIFALCHVTCSRFPRRCWRTVLTCNTSSRSLATFRQRTSDCGKVRSRPSITRPTRVRPALQAPCRCLRIGQGPLVSTIVYKSAGLTCFPQRVIAAVWTTSEHTDGPLHVYPMSAFLVRARSPMVAHTVQPMSSVLRGRRKCCADDGQAQQILLPRPGSLWRSRKEQVLWWRLITAFSHRDPKP